MLFLFYFILNVISFYVISCLRRLIQENTASLCQTFSGSFMVSGFIFRSLNHLEFVFYMWDILYMI